MNPVILKDLNITLQYYEKFISGKGLDSLVITPEFILRKIPKIHDQSTRDKIVKRYLSGIPLKDLSMQFSHPVKDIIAVLEFYNLEIVSPEVPKNLKMSKFNKKNYWKKTKFFRK
ncbi:MAG: hypothetical protein IPQ10_04645 [Saprospiraceae bacterium]|nr:hypothetical protein [Saprospiraceae bacterium]MBK7796257.1 hypothetical protein [Saprospiraceae bacterium]MBK8154556.1 hypothetical protein [Saprospiraceae bacterium]MBK9378274.1 hypothetical protein [Saprospiraceae bacterium]MBL0260352.1 hypothetical protein [Saprospiraceae bacterium]